MPCLKDLFMILTSLRYLEWTPCNRKGKGDDTSKAQQVFGVHLFCKGGRIRYLDVKGLNLPVVKSKFMWADPLLVFILSSLPSRTHLMPRFEP